MFRDVWENVRAMLLKIAQISNFNYHLQLVLKESENKLKMIAIAVRDWFIERHLHYVRTSCKLRY